MTPISVVYFVQCAVTGLIKIGTSDDYRTRLCLLQSQSPTPLVELGVIPGRLLLEKALHRRFKASRHHGEWFLPAADLLDFIEQHVAHGSVTARWISARTSAALAGASETVEANDDRLLAEARARIYREPSAPVQTGAAAP